jgi:acyl carrier protein phosphodiesterase
LNYLAHIYLSGSDELLKIGNFMGDAVHGNKYLTLDPTIQKGILLHRAIDTFTDAHPIFRQSKHRLHEKYGHYSGIITDIFYDYFLSKNWEKFSEKPLEEFIVQFYDSLKTHYQLLNEKTQQIVPYLISQNWLATYASKKGIELTLKRMDYRMKRQSNMQQSITELSLFEQEFETEFLTFFKELCSFTENWKSENLS